MQTCSICRGDCSTACTGESFSQSVDLEEHVLKLLKAEQKTSIQQEV